MDEPGSSDRVHVTSPPGGPFAAQMEADQVEPSALCELADGPPPLRNEAYPWDFSDLAPGDKARVDSTNFIFRSMAAFIEILLQKNILFSVENPAGSLLWDIPIWETILKHAFFVVFDACCYGGKRKTAKSFLTNVKPMRAMAQRCPGSHQHLPFGRVKLGPGRYAFATAEEAAYSRPLCLQIVAQVCQALKLPTTIIQAQPKSAVATAAARGRKVPSLVSEFACISVVTLPPVDTKRCLISQIGSIPKGSKFLSHVLIRKGGDIDHGTRSRNFGQRQCSSTSF